MSERLRVIFAGAGEFGVPTLKALLQRHEVVQVFTQPDRPAGRGRKLTPTPVGQFVQQEASSIPLVATADLNSEQLPEADVLVVIAFGQKIAPHVTDKPRLGAINLHASRLPRYRGAAPIHRAILAGESVTGNSIIRLAPKMDAGAVLGMSLVEIGEMETTGELHDRLAVDGAGLVLQVLEELATGHATEVEQDHSQATLAKKISRETAVLDFSLPAEVVARTIRGLYPWPGCRVEVLDADGKAVGRATLIRAKIGSPATGQPGHITQNGSIACGDGSAIEVFELQPEGGRPMLLNAYRNGRPWPVGGRIASVI